MFGEATRHDFIHSTFPPTHLLGLGRVVGRRAPVHEAEGVGRVHRDAHPHHALALPFVVIGHATAAATAGGDDAWGLLQSGVRGVGSAAR